MSDLPGAVLAIDLPDIPSTESGPTPLRLVEGEVAISEEHRYILPEILVQLQPHRVILGMYISK